MPPTPSTPTVAVPAAINVTSFLRSCCAGLRRARWVNVPGAGGGILGLPGVADHQAKGSTPAIEAGLLPAGEGNTSFAGTISVGLSGCTVADGYISPLPATTRVGFSEEEGITAGMRPVTIGGSNCHFSAGMPASSNQLTVGGSVSCGPCASSWVLELVTLCIVSSVVKTRSKAVTIPLTR